MKETESKILKDITGLFEDIQKDPEEVLRKRGTRAVSLEGVGETPRQKKVFRPSVIVLTALFCLTFAAVVTLFWISKDRWQSRTRDILSVSRLEIDRLKIQNAGIADQLSSVGAESGRRIAELEKRLDESEKLNRRQAAQIKVLKEENLKKN